MKSLKALAILLLAAIPVSCSPKPKPQSAWDHAASFANLKTFAWYSDPTEEKAVGGAIVDARWVDEHVKKAVTAELEKKGMRLADGAPPDFYVDYHTRAAGILQRDQYGQYTWWSPYTYMGSETYRQATLALDVRDTGKKLIWRGWVTGVLGRDPEKLDKQIRKAAADLLRDFPPGQSAVP